MTTAMDVSAVSQAVRARMAAIIESSNTSAVSESKEPTPLWIFLYLYEKAPNDCYVGYMGGAKALAKFLAPIAIPQDLEFRAPNLLYSYETQELAKVLGTTQDIIIHTILDMMKRDIL